MWLVATTLDSTVLNTGLFIIYLCWKTLMTCTMFMWRFKMDSINKFTCGLALPTARTISNEVNFPLTPPLIKILPFYSLFSPNRQWSTRHCMILLPTLSLYSATNYICFRQNLAWKQASAPGPLTLALTLLSVRFAPSLISGLCKNVTIFVKPDSLFKTASLATSYCTVFCITFHSFSCL